MKLIVTGPKRRGKDTLAKWFKANAHLFVPNGTTAPEVHICAFAEELKRQVAQAFDVPVSLFYDDDVKEVQTTRLSFENCKDPRFVEICKTFLPALRGTSEVDGLSMSPREAAQLWGTEYKRNEKDGYWISFVDEKVKAKPNDFYVVADGRFPDELQWGIDSGFLTVAVVPVGWPEKIDHTKGHASETSLSSFKMDIQVENPYKNMAQFEENIRQALLPYMANN